MASAKPGGGVRPRSPEVALRRFDLDDDVELGAMSRKRSSGEGTIYQRTDGRWVASLSLGRADSGKRKRRVVYGLTQAEAREKLRVLRNQHAIGGLTDPSKSTVGEYLRRWFEDVAKPRLKASTIASYDSTLRVHVLPQIGGVKLAKIEPVIVTSMLGAMRRDGAKPRTIELAFVVVKTAMRHAVRTGLVPRNPCDVIDKPKVPKREMRFWSDEQIRKFLAAATGNRLEALFVVALTTGCSIGEVLGLRWRDFDPARKTLRIDRQLLEIDGELHEETPKAEKRRRTIALPDAAVVALGHHRSAMKAEGVGTDAGDRVFVNVNGDPIHRTVLSRRTFATLIAKAGVPKIRLHDLRHTSATLLLAEGVDLKVISKRLGHSRIGVTADTYAHVVDALEHQAAERIGAALSPAGSGTESHGGVATVLPQQFQQRPSRPQAARPKRRKRQ